MLDARHVAGDPALSERAAGGPCCAAWRRDARRRLPELHAAALERAARHGELAFLLEPDLKESRGGLRDVHALHAPWPPRGWPTRRRSACAAADDLAARRPRRAAPDARTRPADRLVQQEQDRRGGATRASRIADDLMQRRLRGRAGDRVRLRRDVAAGRARRSRPAAALAAGRAPQRRPLADGVVEQDGEVVLARDASPATDPVLLLRVAARPPSTPCRWRRTRWSGCRRVARRCPSPGRRRRGTSSSRCSAAGPALVPVVEALDQAGLFVRLLPEWERVRCKPPAQPRAPVHRRPAPGRGRGRGGGARPAGSPGPTCCCSRRCCTTSARAGRGTTPTPACASYPGRSGAPRAATRRRRRARHAGPPPPAAPGHRDPPRPGRPGDRSGPWSPTRGRPEHARAAARPHRVADALATGPAAWGEWKAGLVADLVARCGAVLEGEPPPRPATLDGHQRALADAGELAVEVAGDEVTIVAPDRPGLLCRWAGVLALHRLTIRAATATSLGSTAVTVFEVSPRFGSPPDWDLVRADVRRAYEDAASPGGAPRRAGACLRADRPAGGAAARPVVRRGLGPLARSSRCVRTTRSGCSTGSPAALDDRGSRRAVGPREHARCGGRRRLLRRRRRGGASRTAPGAGSRWSRRCSRHAAQPAEHALRLVRRRRRTTAPCRPRRCRSGPRTRGDHARGRGVGHHGVDRAEALFDVRLHAVPGRPSAGSARTGRAGPLRHERRMDESRRALPRVHEGVDQARQPGEMKTRQRRPRNRAGNVAATQIRSVPHRHSGSVGIVVPRSRHDRAA